MGEILNNEDLYNITMQTRIVYRKPKEQQQQQQQKTKNKTNKHTNNLTENIKQTQINKEQFNNYLLTV